jgi:predicted component of type VI protein secretion system
MTVTLVAFSRKGARKDFTLDAPSTIIGRTPEAEIQVPINEVSRRHCQIQVNGAKILLRDLGSSNGTFVNDHKVSEAALKAGDRVRVGPVTFVVQVDGVPANIGPGQAAAPPAAAKPAAPAAPARAASPDAKTKISTPATPARPDEDIDLDNLELDDLSDFDLGEMSPLEDVEEIGEDEIEEIAEDDLADEDEPPAKK